MNDTIYKINYSQSCLINNINTWKKKDDLKKIFKNDKNIEFYNNNKKGEIDLYITIPDNENEKEIQKRKTD